MLHHRLQRCPYVRSGITVGCNLQRLQDLLRCGIIWYRDRPYYYTCKLPILDWQEDTLHWAPVAAFHVHIHSIGVTHQAAKRDRL